MKCRIISLLVLLSLSLSSYSEILLTEEQYNEIKKTVAELKQINEDNQKQIEILENQQEISEKIQASQNDYIDTLEKSSQKSTRLTVWEKIENFLNGFLWGGLITSLIYGVYANY